MAGAGGFYRALYARLYALTGASKYNLTKERIDDIMAFTTIKNGNNYNSTQHHEYQIDSLATASNTDIQTELATLPECIAGSIATNASLDLICVKKNDGSWQIIK